MFPELQELADAAVFDSESGGQDTGDDPPVDSSTGRDGWSGGLSARTSQSDADENEGRSDSRSAKGEDRKAADRRGHGRAPERQPNAENQQQADVNVRGRG